MDLSDRMKHYEQESVGKYLIKRCPAILRLDGRAFHSFCKGFIKPWDCRLQYCMHSTGISLCKEISTAKFAYGQSDEISVLLTDYDNLETEQWFGGAIQKIVSVAASFATLSFNNIMRDLSEQIKGGSRFVIKEHVQEYPLSRKAGQAMFDARVFSIPKEDVVNYFVWRQQDAIRNSISSLAQSVFSHKSLLGLNSEQLIDKLKEESDLDWNKCPIYEQRGWSIQRSLYNSSSNPMYSFADSTQQREKKQWVVNLAIPIISENRGYVSEFLQVDGSTADDFGEREQEGERHE
jgi:tRNA(His) 5'-end guanylyltransferase